MIGKVEEFEFFSLFEFFPIEYPDNHTIGFLLRPSEFYRETAGLFSAEVDYDNKEVVVYMVNDIEKPFNGDSVIQVKLEGDYWRNFVTDIGSYEDNKRRKRYQNEQRVLAVAPGLAAANEGRLELGLLRKIRNYLGGGKRSTRKRSTRKRSTRKRGPK